MRVVRFIPLIFVIILFFNTIEFANKERNWKDKSYDKSSRVIESINRVPLYFIRNDGQVNEMVKFYEKGRGRSTFFTHDGIYIALERVMSNKEVKEKCESAGTREFDTKKEIKAEYIAIKPYDMRKDVKIEADGEIEGKVNYFVGNDPSKWKANIPTYSKIRYKGIYEGIDLVFYGNQSELEYDVEIRPEGDLSNVLFIVEGARDMRRVDEGLEIVLENGKIIQKKPFVYQVIEGKKIRIAADFEIIKINDSFAYGFKVGEYNRNYALIIDPFIISYSTYLGGGIDDLGYGITVDSAGYVYVTGSTASIDFPVQNAYSNVFSGETDVFVSKLSSGGSRLIFSTYIGGDRHDIGEDIAIDSTGNIYITGRTSSSNFPTTHSALSRINKGYTDAFVAKMAPNGDALLYSTYLGGSNIDHANGITLDSSGNFYITGATNSTDFPTKDAYQTTLNGSNFFDAFVTSFNSSGNLIYSTYLGGNNNDEAFDIAVNSKGNAIIVGTTASNNFPVKNPYDNSFNGGSLDIFITKVSSDGKSLIYSSYFGSDGRDEATSIALDSLENIYIAGATNSGNFPTKAAYDSSFNGGYDGFISKFDSSGSTLIFSTYFGGGGTDYLMGIKLDNSQNIYLSGYTDSKDIPVENPFNNTLNGKKDVFVAKMGANGNNLLFSSYLGGSGDDFALSMAIDLSGNIYLIGYTESANFPVKNAYDKDFNGGRFDSFITKISEIQSVSYTLTVTKSGTGSGNVTSNPSGIDCGPDCSEIYNAGAEVVLIAIADSNSTFDGWGGDCAFCGLNTECKVKMDSNKECVAEFIPGHLVDAGLDTKGDIEDEDITKDILIEDIKDDTHIVSDISHLDTSDDISDDISLLPDDSYYDTNTDNVTDATDIFEITDMQADMSYFDISDNDTYVRADAIGDDVLDAKVDKTQDTKEELPSSEDSGCSCSLIK